MKFIGKEVELVIFDMDGTLIDSTGIWAEIDKEFFAKRGINEVPEDYGQQIVHMGLEKGAAMTIEKYGFVNDTVEGVIKEWQDASIDEYLHKIPLKPYAKEILEYLKNNNVKLALATANDKELYEPCLKRLGIDKYFDIITDVNKVKEGKSSPKIFDSVVEEIKTTRDKTVIFEDTIMGLRTANKAGYIVVGVDDEASRCIEKEKMAECYKYIYSFEELLNK